MLQEKYHLFTFFFERVNPLIFPEEKKNPLILSDFVLVGGNDKKCQQNG